MNIVHIGGVDMNKSVSSKEEILSAGKEIIRELDRKSVV